MHAVTRSASRASFIGSVRARPTDHRQSGLHCHSRLAIEKTGSNKPVVCDQIVGQVRRPQENANVDTRSAT